MFFSAVYACTTHILRRELWSKLTLLQQRNPGPWCFIGDFNAILGDNEKRGGNLLSRMSCEEFQAWTDSCNLTHLLTKGVEFTWINKRRVRSLIEMRLDRSICNDECLAFWNTISCYSLTRYKSDHHPLLLHLQRGAKCFPSSFKFHKIWLDHLDCSRLVPEVWNRPVKGCRMYVLPQKLKLLKMELKSWNKHVFGDVHLKVGQAIATVSSLKLRILNFGYSATFHEQQVNAHSNLQQPLNYQEAPWNGKSMINWHCFGDRNT